jgi:hypothetical protein
MAQKTLIRIVCLSLHVKKISGARILICIKSGSAENVTDPWYYVKESRDSYSVVHNFSYEILLQVPVTAVPDDSEELDREAEWICKYGFQTQVSRTVRTRVVEL